jgi:hypothetical protein
VNERPPSPYTFSPPLPCLQGHESCFFFGLPEDEMRAIAGHGGFPEADSAALELHRSIESAEGVPELLGTLLGAEGREMLPETVALGMLR